MTKTNTIPAAMDGNIKSVLLHEFEEKNIVLDSSISTVTWFDGDIHIAARRYRFQVKMILKMNPWLAGKLQRHQTEGLNLVFEEKPLFPSELDIDKIFQFHNHHESGHDMNSLFLGMNLKNATEISLQNDYAVKPANKLIGTDNPIFKVSIVPDMKNQSYFALIVSLSHRVGDGFTFYSLYNMLKPNSIPIALNPERKLDVIHRIEERMGKKMLEGIGGLWVKLLFVRDILYAKVTKAQWGQKMFLINTNFVNQEKETHQCTNSLLPISTNDIIVSSCFKAASADMGLMSINFRGRIENCDKTDAPNYFNTIIYRPPDYDSPALIRKSISGEKFKRAAEPPTSLIPNTPSCLVKTIHVSICTNWCTFNAGDIAPDNIKQLIHFPLKDMQYGAPSLISNFTIFKPYQNETAILVTGTPEMIDRFSQSSLVLREITF